jgi:hypothetical protein
MRGVRGTGREHASLIEPEGADRRRWLGLLGHLRFS